MTTYTWKINSLSVMNVPEESTAVMSNFTISGVDGSLTGSVTYSVNLLPADADNFTPYADITQAMAIQWTKDALGTDRVTAMESEVQAQIDTQKIPTPQPKPLPWVSAETTEVVEEVVTPSSNVV
jgi:hypothetical protein